MAKSITVGKRENEKKRLAKREEKQKKKDSKKLSSKSSFCLLYTSPSPRDGATSRMPSSA